MNQFTLESQKEHPCNGCHYWRDMAVCYGCHYLLVTGKRRPCAPGEGCTCKKPYDADAVKREGKLMFNQAFREYNYAAD